MFVSQDSSLTTGILQTGIRAVFVDDARPGADCQQAHQHHVPDMTSLTVWFDGSCPLCTREIALMRRLDRRQPIDFIDVADANSTCPLDRKLLLERLHAQENGGAMMTGAAAFAAMWRAIPLLRLLGVAARNPGVLRLLERLYLVFLRFRPPSPVLSASRRKA